MRRIPVGLIVSLLAVGALAFWVFRKKAEPPRIFFAAAARETISSTLATNGKVEPIEFMDVRVELSGLVKRLLVHSGDNVRAGQVLAEISQPGMAEDIQASEARLAQARAALETLQAGGRGSEQTELETEANRLKQQRAAAQRNLESLQRLQSVSAATPFEVQQAHDAVADLDVQIQSLGSRRTAIVGKADIAAAQARVHEAEANLNLARTHAGESTVVAPLAGTVYDLPARQGAFLNRGDAVGSIGRLDPVRVRVYVDEPELGRVEAGEAVRITWDALPGREWTGVVERKPTEVVALGSRQVGEVLCTIANPGRDLTPGTNVNAFILTKVAHDALAIPRTTVRHDKGTGVFLLKADNTLVWRPVKTGISNALSVEVLSGLNAGDRVAQPSDQPLKDGMAVTPAVP